MTPEEFRRYGHAVIDWVAQYLTELDARPVAGPAAPGAVRAQLPPHPPEEAEAFDTILRDVDDIIVPGLTHWQHPRFFGYFPANNSWPSILGELLSAGLGVQGMLWATSPACTELEMHVLEWLRLMLGLPERFAADGAGGGVIQDSASSATLCALLAARHRVSGGDVETAGVQWPLTVYASAEAHSSVEKAVRIAGLGSEQLRQVAVDDRFRLRPAALEEAIVADARAGRTPTLVVATVGTTSSGAVDPLPAIGEVCRRHGVWLHVDAAMHGTAALCEEYRHIHDGVAFADSYCVNPHKWMLTNFDCDAFWVADRRPLLGALSVLPEYLRNVATDEGAVVDYRDWQIPLGRRFRALKLWFVIRSFGASGLRAHVREHVALAEEFASWVADDEQFELVVPRALNLVCFRHVGGDEASEALLRRLNDTGQVFLTHTRLAGAYTLRMAIGGRATSRTDVEDTWSLIRQTASGLRT